MRFFQRVRARVYQTKADVIFCGSLAETVNIFVIGV